MCVFRLVGEKNFKIHFVVKNLVTDNLSLHLVGMKVMLVLEFRACVRPAQYFVLSGWLVFLRLFSRVSHCHINKI